MAAQTKENEDLVAAMEEVLPLTVGDGSEYRTETDERGVRHVKKEKIINTGRQLAPQIKPNWKGLPKFTEDYKCVVQKGHVKTYSNKVIKGVNTGGVIGNIANKFIQKQYGEK